GGQRSRPRITHTDGWATAMTLYAVRSAYDIESESFRVSYLAHEAQHFADYGRFPKLARPEREYRAKLTELAEAQATARSPDSLCRTNANRLRAAEPARERMSDPQARGGSCRCSARRCGVAQHCGVASQC